MVNIKKVHNAVNMVNKTNNCHSVVYYVIKLVWLHCNSIFFYTYNFLINICLYSTFGNTMSNAR